MNQQDVDQDVNLEYLSPDQFFSTPSAMSDCPGEVRLMRAVLEDAITVYQKSLGSTVTPADVMLGQEAEEWLFSGDDVWPFSFVNICHALEVDPEYVQRGLRGFKTAGPRIVHTRAWFAA